MNSAPKSKAYLPWVEKYRPKSIDAISHQTDVVATLKKNLQTANLPHLLFYGPPGTGKTSTILAVSRELFGPTLMKKRVMELNASDERGINVVRTKIKTFARVAVASDEAASRQYPCPPYKIIILDEADSMTPDAQSALRRTMEKWSKVTRFCLICNYVSRIIAPIASRCAKFRFQPLADTAISSKLKEIAGFENTVVNDDTISTLIKVSQGDMRKAITLLQSTQMLKEPGELLESSDVLRVCVVVPQSVIQRLYDTCKGCNNFQEIHELVTELVADGYPVNSVLQALTDVVVDDESLGAQYRAAICLRVAEADKKLCDGADEFLQLLDVLGEASRQIALHRNKQDDPMDL